MPKYSNYFLLIFPIFGFEFFSLFFGDFFHVVELLIFGCMLMLGFLLVALLDILNEQREQTQLLRLLSPSEARHQDIQPHGQGANGEESQAQRRKEKETTSGSANDEIVVPTRAE